ncbi:hypothetical protein [Lunatibacter salilacus]|uniref:hypothetical protein n=1 Tax=Lunatibacter salilacus TaxID=2483804 RepID=UPI00131B19CA|nr:hypothetical protein [Lunatibacter salilacus]
MEGHDYLALVEKIIESRSFGRSDTYANLLRYLMTCSLEDRVPKEATIAAEIFGKTGFDPSQSTLVRVYLYNLRKKLKKYYSQEGAEDPVVLHIPTGSYRIEFTSTESQPTFSKSATSFSKRTVLIALLAFAVITLGYLLFLEKDSRHSFSKEPLWQDLLSGDQPTMLLLGDLFIYTAFDSALGTTRILRDTRINSRQEFDSYREQHPDIASELGTLSYGLLIQSSALWIKRLTEIFHAAKKDYTIRMVSRFNPKELQDYDIMVVGMIKTLGIFRSYFANSAFRYDIDDDALVLKTSTDGEGTVYKPSGDPDAYHTDYAVMAKFPGPNNNTVYLFGGIWDTGATQSLKCFTDPRLLESLKAEMVKTLGEVPEYYEVLLEVNGVDRMELTPKILQVHAISNPSAIWAAGR